MRKYVFPPEAAERLQDLLCDESMQALAVEDAPALEQMFTKIEQEYK